MRSLPSKWKAMFLDDGDGEREREKRTGRRHNDVYMWCLMKLNCCYYIYMYAVEFTQVLYHSVMTIGMYYLFIKILVSEDNQMRYACKQNRGGKKKV